MRNAVEVAAQVGVNDFGASAQERAFDRVHRLRRVALGSIGVAVGMTVGFPNRQEQQGHCRLDDAVFDRGDAQWPGLSVAFGKAHPPHRAGPIRLGAQFFEQRVPPLLPRFVAAGVGRARLPVHSRRAVVAGYGAHRSFDEVAPQQFSVEAVEPVARCSLGFAVERALQLLNLWRSCYPVEKRCRLRPAIIRSLAVSARVDPSAPPSLAAGYTVRQVITTTRDSDYSSGLRRLDGVAILRGGLRL